MGYKSPEWTGVAKLRDGRQFVTDGNIALEVETSVLEPMLSAETQLLPLLYRTEMCVA